MSRLPVCSDNGSEISNFTVDANAESFEDISHHATSFVKETLKKRMRGNPKIVDHSAQQSATVINSIATKSLQSKTIIFKTESDSLTQGQCFSRGDPYAAYMARMYFITNEHEECLSKLREKKATKQQKNKGKELYDDPCVVCSGKLQSYSLTLASKIVKVDSRIGNKESLQAEKETSDLYIQNRCIKMEVKEGAIKCFKCGSYQTTHATVITRRCDEGSTKFVKCLNCGHNFRL